MDSDWRLDKYFCYKGDMWNLNLGRNSLYVNYHHLLGNFRPPKNNTTCYK